MDLTEMVPGEAYSGNSPGLLRSTVAFTSFNLAYTDRALILLRSIRRHHPEWRVFALLVEPGYPNEAWKSALAEFDGVMFAHQVFGPVFEQWVRHHSVVEACTGVKGVGLLHLLDQDADNVLYLDPDIKIYSRLDPVLEVLEEQAVVLTPHGLAPARRDDAIWDTEIGSLKHGTYNLGFLAVRNCIEGRELARWWAQRLKIACWDAPDKGLFTDQRWMDLAPALFPKVEIARDPGLNVASWNLSNRALEFSSGKYLVNGSPLRFYHFTKAGAGGDDAARVLSNKSAVVERLWREYSEELAATRFELPESPSWGYAPGSGAREAQAIRSGGACGD